VQEFIRGWASAQESRKAGQRTRDALRRKAEQGYVAGGDVFGYRRVREGSHVRRVVNEPEAAIVRRIFQTIAEGSGLLRIVKTLTAENAPSPKGRGWAVSNVRGMLDRDLYRGRVIYGRSRRQRRGGTKRQVEAPESEWIVRETPELRIVDETLWKAAHARLARTRQTYTGHRTATGTLHGRPEAGLLSRHLLAGHLRCGVCGGGMFVASRISTNGRARLYYLCTNHHKQGIKACSNRYSVPYEVVTRAILSHFIDLEPQVLVEILMAEWQRRLVPIEQREAQRAALTAELHRLDGELARLTEAVAAGAGDVRVVFDALKRKQTQRDETTARLEHLDGLQRAEDAPDGAAWLEWMLPRLAGLKAALEADPATGREVLRELLIEPVTITPVTNEAGRVIAWDYIGLGALDRVVSGQIPDGRTQRQSKSVHINNPPFL